jgi:acyl carrier protein
MNLQEVTQRVNTVMQQGFEIKSELLKPEAKLFEELGLDSLDAVDLVVHLEETLSVKVEVERFQNVRTLGDVYTLVGELTSGLESNA